MGRPSSHSDTFATRLLLLTLPNPSLVIEAVIHLCPDRTITGAGGGGDYTWWQPLGLDTGTEQVFTKEDKAINDKPLRGVLSLVFLVFL